MLRKRLLFRCQSRRSLGGTYSALFIIPTKTLCVVPNSGLTYSKTIKQNEACSVNMHVLPAPTSQGFPFCLCKLKNLTCWPNRPMMEIGVWISHATTYNSFVLLHTEWLAFEKEKVKRIKMWKAALGFRISSPTVKCMRNSPEQNKIPNEHTMHRLEKEKMGWRFEFW